MATLFKRPAPLERSAPPSAADDMRLLQETVETLIERLKVASSQAVSELDRRQRRLEALLDRADARCEALEGRYTPEPTLMESPSDRIYRLHREGLDEASIATQIGINRGEVALMLGLRAARR